jgi:predicted SnoaL-like aldol condensation-catalyzing enzyme
LAGQSSSAQESKNQQMVLNWYRDVIMSGHVDQASKYMADDYIEHDPTISGGRAGFVQHYSSASARPAQAKPVMYDEETKDPNGNTYQADRFEMVRLKDGKIVEHWDVANRRVNAQSWKLDWCSKAGRNDCPTQ